MITYGLRMQERADAIPKDVAEWLKERNALYPNINFHVNCWEPSSSEKTEWEENARKYSRIFVKDGGFGWGISDVFFPYLDQVWAIKIIGLANEKGEILHPENSEYENGVSLPPHLRFEIAGVPPVEMLEKFNHSLGLPRKENEPVLKEPKEFVLFTPDGRWTSELLISGADFEPFVEFAPLLKDEDPNIREEALRLYYKKDWKSLRRLKERRG